MTRRSDGLNVNGLIDWEKMLLKANLTSMTLAKDMKTLLLFAQMISVWLMRHTMTFDLVFNDLNLVSVERDFLL